MAYDRSIELRIDALIIDWPNIEKKKMFGGVCYLTRGNMCFGIWQGSLIVRTDPATAGEQLRKPYVRPFDVTGKPMKGWLMVSSEGWPTEATMTGWLNMGREFALTLPGK
ncbi:MAG: TfoX/Sxy family protein [Desulfobacteraceae bacterium]|nr:TfoX/Sxy family protein [Desulfobacteraceae bacterium]